MSNSGAAGDASRLLDGLIAMLKKLHPGELSEEQHGILESKAIYAVSVVRSVRNMAAPVHRLPLEVLGLIFSELMEPQDSFIPDLLHIRTPRPQPIQTTSMVSRRWREAVLSFPGLWSTVHVCEDERLLNIIERSGDTLLRIFVFSPLLRSPDTDIWELPSMRLLVPMIHTIISHSNRIQELHLVDVSIEKLNETCLMKVPLPKLECLTLVMDVKQQIFPLSFLASDVPLLKKVTFIRCPLSAAENLPGLTHLCIASVRSSSPPGQMVDILRALPDLEELLLGQVTLGHDSTSLHHNKVILARLRVIGLHVLSRSYTVSEFLQHLLLPSDVELFIWGAHVSLTSPALHTLIPAFITPKKPVKELRLTAPLPVRKRSRQNAVPSLRSRILCSIVSNPSAFQLDGCLTGGTTLFSQIPDLLDLSSVRVLWLGQKYHEEPSLDEWRSFLTCFPALDTLVIVHRPSHPIISALTLSKDDASGILPCTNLRTLRILDRTLSAFRLLLFAKQRDRMGCRLNLCEILSPTPLPHPPSNDACGEPHYDECSTQDEATIDDVAALRDYIDDVVCLTRHFSWLWDVLPSPVFDWVRRIWGVQYK